jgi:hypothetical protein
VRKSTLLASFAIFIAATDNAYAYLDPGTGSIILQAIVAGVASTLFAVRMYWSRIKEKLGMSRASDEDDQGPSEPAQ